MTTPRIHDAGVADLPAVVRLLADDHFGAAREAPGPVLDRRYADAFAAIVAIPGWAVMLAEEDGAVVGCLQFMVLPQLSHTGTASAQVEGVRVAASHRGAGIGSALMRAAIARARDAGCGTMQLTSHASRVDARRFYERLGFAVSHTGFKLNLGGTG
ncbi:GNAT family N-acetyltransferase [Roseomonas elaeocarpi]|uniref:GNAT family N-acetyltransferase n=1 Tax=Roseomonas elaeocarpi TaxID=907779 RepID=A0ABV6JTJ0_9PROT